MIKKLLLLFTIFLLAIPIYSTPYAKIIDTSFRPLSLRFKAMGESGIAIPKREEVFFINPAGLADDDYFYLRLPDISLSLYQAKDILSSPLDTIFQGDVAAILDLVGILNGTFPLLVAEENISTSFNSFGFSLDIKEEISTEGQSFSSGFIPAIFSSFSFGYGREWEIDKGYALSLGIMEHISGVWYSTPIGAEAVVNLLKGDSSALEYISSTLKFSTDIGAVLKVPHGFSFGLAFNDISRGITLINNTNGSIERLYNQSLISIGSGWSYNFKDKIELSFSYDIVNLIELFSALSFDSFLYHSNFGAEIGIYDTLYFYTGLKGGYPSFGLEAKLWFIDIALLYRYQEFGAKIGLNPKDELEIRLAFTF